MNENQKKQVEDLVRQLHLSLGDPDTQDRGHAVFLIGAGCSSSAGIPLAKEIAKTCVSKLVNKYSKGKISIDDPDKAIKWLYDNNHINDSWKPDNPDWGNLYGKIFEEHFQADIFQKEIIKDAIDKSNNKINWAHICLGELVKRGYVHTVLTTNFDQLVIRGIINTGLIPVIADGIGALTRIDSKPQTPQVVHIHGSMHTYSLRNSAKDVQEIENMLPVEGTMYGLLRDSALLVVVGYAGGEEAVMKLLVKSATHFNKMVVYWAMYEDDYKSLSPNALTLMESGNNKFVITKCDADDFFARILEGLEIGVPEWMNNPIQSLLEQSLEFAKTTNPDIQIKIQNYKDKIKKLNDFWNTKSASKTIEEEVATLRLGGKFEEALSKLEKKTGNTYELLKLKAETAFEAGQESRKKKYIEKSVNYWRQVLQTTTPKSNSKQWSELQFGLGKALQLLSEIESNKDFISRAVDAYEEALKIKSFRNDAEKFVEAQNNLGVALIALNELVEDSEYVTRAVSAHKSALKKIKRENNQKVWAETQSNLAGTLQMLGELTNTPKKLEESINAYELALSEYTQDKFPTDWAKTQFNLGGALQKLGEIKDDSTILQRAVEAYNDALKVYTSDENQAWTLQGLGNTLQQIGEKQEDSQILEDSQEAYNKALNFFVKFKDSEMCKLIRKELKKIKSEIDTFKNI